MIVMNFWSQSIRRSEASEYWVGADRWRRFGFFHQHPCWKYCRSAARINWVGGHCGSLWILSSSRYPGVVSVASCAVSPVPARLVRGDARLHLLRVFCTFEVDRNPAADTEDVWSLCCGAQVLLRYLVAPDRLPCALVCRGAELFAACDDGVE